MDLPNPGQDAVPFTPLTAQFYDETIENIEALAAALGGDWASYTPSWTGFTPGNGTLNYGHYVEISKTVILRFKFTLGTTSSASGIVKMSLPVAAKAYAAAFNSTGRGVFYDASGFVYQTFDVCFESTTTVGFLMNNCSGTFVAWNYLDNTTPAAPAVGDFMQGYIIYEAA